MDKTSNNPNSIKHYIIFYIAGVIAGVALGVIRTMIVDDYVIGN